MIYQVPRDDRGRERWIRRQDDVELAELIEVPCRSCSSPVTILHRVYPPDPTTGAVVRHHECRDCGLRFESSARR